MPEKAALKYTVRCKLFQHWRGSYQKQLFNIYIIMDITYQKPSLEYYGQFLLKQIGHNDCVKF